MIDSNQNIGIALALGVVEGLTEFLPVSSTGHLILFSSILKYDSPEAATFEIFIQLGAILAVLYLYFSRFLELFKFTPPQTGLRGRAGITKLAIACLPAFILGAAFHHQIKELLFRPAPVAWALIVGGIIMWLIELRATAPRVTSLEALSVRDALVIGLFQCLALWPGMSRSGSTIIGGLAIGVDKKTAAEFSFIIAVPIMVAATGYDLLKSFPALEDAHIVPFALGFIVSFLTAVIAIKFFMAILQRFKLAVFSAYRIILGILVIVLMS